MGLIKSMSRVWRGTLGNVGGFEAAQGNRRLRRFIPSRLHLNTLLMGAGADITARARYLVRNNGYAANAAESWTGNAVGTGFNPSSRITNARVNARMAALWLRWTDVADAEGLTDFGGLQRRAAREMFITGETFLVFRPQPASAGLEVPLQLQLLPTEMLPMNKNEILGNGNTIRCGIEFNPKGQRVAYHFYRRHPGDLTVPDLTMETVRIPAVDVIHLYDAADAGQLRGVSRLAPAIVKLFLLDQYDDAELDRKKVAAMYAMFITSPAPPPESALKKDDDRVLDVQPGQIVELAPGEQMQTSTPADVGQTYEPFEYRTILQISAATGVPYAYVSGDMLKANYSNSRMALLEFRRRVEAWQHAVMVWQMCRKVWERWVDMAVLSGALTLRGYEAKRFEYLACDWRPPKWDWVDPLKDARAEIELINAGLKSRSQSIAERGEDSVQVDMQIAADRQREAKLGISFAPVNAQQPIQQDENPDESPPQDQQKNDQNP